MLTQDYRGERRIGQGAFTSRRIQQFGGKEQSQSHYYFTDYKFFIKFIYSIASLKRKETDERRAFYIAACTTVIAANTYAGI